MHIYFFNTIQKIYFIYDFTFYMYHYFYNYLYIQGHLDSFCTVAIVTSIAVNMGYSSPFDMLILFLWAIHPIVGLLCQLHMRSKAINECPVLFLAILFWDEFYVV